MTGVFPVVAHSRTKRDVVISLPINPFLLGGGIVATIVLVGVYAADKLAVWAIATAVAAGWSSAWSP